MFNLLEIGNSTATPVVSNLRSKPYIEAGAREFRVFAFFLVSSQLSTVVQSYIYTCIYASSDPHTFTYFPTGRPVAVVDNGIGYTGD